MKWFKHMTNASDDEFIAALEGEFGIAGYAHWFKMLEVIAKQMDKTDRCFATYPQAYWQQVLGFKQGKKLQTFLKFCETFGKVNVELMKSSLKIECPKLLKLKDEYAQKSGQTPPQTSEAETETDNNLHRSEIKPTGEGFDIMILIDDNARSVIRNKADGWDVYFLASIFNEKVRGGWKPSNPVGAFIAFCEKYTKGKTP